MDWYFFGTKAVKIIEKDFSMHFSHSRYLKLISNIKQAGYSLCGYSDWNQFEHPCILRHDIDFSLERARDIALLEADNGIRSTYFVLLTTDMYNPLSKNGEELLRTIINAGHDIGLHYDESRYSNSDKVIRNNHEYVEQILYEKNILEYVCGVKVKAVSMHCPSRDFLSSDVDIPGMVNSYSKLFFNEFKYCSDSMRVWHEDIEKELDVTIHQKIHILIHAFWWRSIEEDRDDTIRKWIKERERSTYDYFRQWYPSV